jgi:hypothetical protein
MSVRRLGFVVAALLSAAISLPRTAAAQDVDVIRGRVTGPDSVPVERARVTVTSISGGVQRNAQTDRNGRYTITFPGGDGDYIVSIAAIGFIARSFEIKRVADEDILIADARLTRIVQEVATVEVTASGTAPRVNRNDNPPDISGTDRAIALTALPPDLQGNLAAMAASLPGVTFLPGIDGAADAFSVLGLGPDQNSTTLNGMEFGASNLPRDAAITSSLVTSPYDVSRGGFSGAQLGVRTRSGNNFFTRGMSLNLQAPQMQWTDRAAQALGQEFTNFSLSGILSGPIKRNQLFYNVSYQAGRRSADLRTLLNTGAPGLQAAGIAQDSVVRLLSILGVESVPASIGDLPGSRNSDNGSVQGSLDWSPASSVSGSAYNISFSGGWSRERPTGGNVTELPSYSGERDNWNGSIQSRHSGYFKNLLTETSLGVNASIRDAAPYLFLPAGRVRVNSTLGDGTGEIKSLAFGGNPTLSSSNRSNGASLMNTLSWFSGTNKHRLKLTSEVRYSATESEQSSNLLGTFNFASLADLESGTPSSFTRQLSTRKRNSNQVVAGLSLGDSWRRSTDFQLQYGIRVDRSFFFAEPKVNPLVESTYGVRNDIVPNGYYVSPRVGFSWTLGDASQITGFEGAFRGPRAVVRGGIGLFQSTPGSGLISSAVENTGLPSAVQQLNCVGIAAPIPDWELYMTNPELVPDRCADGTAGTVFANSSPNVTLFSPDFRPPQSVRTNLSWNGAILDNRFTLNAEATYSANLYQQGQIDLNFNPLVRFNLPDEQGRPVFVQPTSIVSSTGSIGSRDERVSSAFSRVTQMRSDLRSETRQLTLRLSPLRFTPSQKLTWNTAYVYSNNRERIRGFNSTVGNPLDVEWARGAGDSRHQISYGLGYNFGGYVRVNWSGSFRSGAPFTPMVIGDVNGDGYSNDRAFIFDPANTADPALAAEMERLLGSTSGAAAKCLRSQLGQLAGRNSCQGPWTSSASLGFTLDPVKFRMPNRAQIQFSLSNPLGAADLLVNGSNNLRGWGQSNSPDQALLYVKGFDASTQRFKYEVNQRFGATRPAFVALRSPVILTMAMRFDIGPTRERQNLMQQLSNGRSVPGTKYPETLFRSAGTTAIPNTMATILRQQDTLKLTAMQADSMATMNRLYTIAADSIWAPVAKMLTELPEKFNEEQAYDEYIRARHATVDLMMYFAPKVNALLTPTQRRKLPAGLSNSLDTRYLLAIRSGNGLYLGGGGTSLSPVLAGSLGAELALREVMIVR